MPQELYWLAAGIAIGAVLIAPLTAWLITRAIVTRAQRFSVEKNAVITMVYASATPLSQACNIDAKLSDVCNAFLDDVAPGWRRRR